jgi:hypothetical protein
MKMATVILNAYTASKFDGGLSIALCVAGEPPFPRRTVEIKNLADIVAAFEVYKVEAAATGKPLALSVLMKNGDRKPPGFNKLVAAIRYETVNI